MNATYSHDISAGQYGYIGLADRYHVDILKITSYVSSHGQTLKKIEDGWAQQWYRFDYRYGETNSANIEPPKPIF
ncbi:hypothetical protein [Fusibacter ferrireducens]|uniref:Uncharacterized protein n=1 Tax=Fusibacter ferrireducens TaxID=2785058 RepID=A0ABR9ZUU4_9FIRM|nr:hypothetical protein [Fusibacter ferrireducens]MBF4694241.1 hypothetical protein [Fusibacter ferrireducens]